MATFLDALRPLDDRFDQLQANRRIPGVAWGVVRDGELVHSGGAGTIRDGEDRRPDADSVFRIASMTKSFTAATILLLRDEARIRLDDPVGLHVPELAAWTPPTADSDPVTIRALLTMSAGLATDDPWGDRQQDLPLDRFAELLASGPSFAWPPGVTYDYSNLGYGILGRVVTNVAGAEYRHVVRDRLLVPMGMTGTTYLEEDVPEAYLAHGYVRRGDVLVREGREGYGAFASMGGIFSSVRDLSRWVAGFLDAFPARSDPEGSHPLRRASRREMQQVQRMFSPDVDAHDPHDDPVVRAGGYGFGLFVSIMPGVGTVVSHSGGYPGFGSNMSWHPASGLGLVGLGNIRYAPFRAMVVDALVALVESDTVPRRTPRPLPAVERLRAVVEDLLAHWDDGIADDAFAMNMDLDQPREDRRAALAKVAADLGRFRRDDTRPARSASPAQLEWWLRCERGWARVAMLLTPEPSPRIQALHVTQVGDPSPALVEAATGILAAAGSPAPAWPRSLATVDGFDTAPVLRALRAAGPRWGEVRLGLPIDGDGAATATWQLETERGSATLRLALDPAGAVATVALRVPEREAPDEGW